MIQTEQGEFILPDASVFTNTPAGADASPQPTDAGTSSVPTANGDDTTVADAKSTAPAASVSPPEAASSAVKVVGTTTSSLEATPELTPDLSRESSSDLGDELLDKDFARHLDEQGEQLSIIAKRIEQSADLAIEVPVVVTRPTRDGINVGTSILGRKRPFSEVDA